MPERLDDYSYLDEDKADDGFGYLELSERDTALVVALPDLDYDSQLIAIRELLDRHRNAEAEHAAEIKKAEQLVRDPVRTRHPKDGFIAALEEGARQQNWIDHMHYSVYHHAAHSMAAVGLIAPLVESIFYQSFRSIEREMTKELSLPNDHARWQRPAEDQWDCHYVWKKRPPECLLGRRHTTARGCRWHGGADARRPATHAIGALRIPKQDVSLRL